MHHPIVGAVNKAMNCAKYNKNPRTRDQQRRHGIGRKSQYAEHVKQNRYFKQVAEIISGICVVQSLRGLARSRDFLGGNATRAHFSDPRKIKP